MEWLVFFSDGDRFAWWDVFTRPGWRHVSVCRYDAGAGCWLFYDVKAGGTRLDVLLPGPEVDLRLGGLLSVSRVLRFRSRGHDRIVPAVFGCVGAVQHLLGVRGAFTPWGLWRHLLAQGAEIWPDVAPRDDLE